MLIGFDNKPCMLSLKAVVCLTMKWNKNNSHFQVFFGTSIIFFCSSNPIENMGSQWRLFSGSLVGIFLYLCNDLSVLDIAISGV